MAIRASIYYTAGKSGITAIAVQLGHGLDSSLPELSEAAGRVLHYFTRELPRHLREDLIEQAARAYHRKALRVVERCRANTILQLREGSFN